MDQRLTQPAVTDWRELCVELADKLAACWPSTFDAPDCLNRAREALAQPEPEVVGPSNEELLELMPETMRDEFSYAAKACSDVTGSQVKPGIFRVCLNTAALEYARAVIARWGRPAPAPAGEVEVRDVVTFLKNEADLQIGFERPHASIKLTRAADLLEQRQAAPAAVASDTRYEFSVLDADCTEQAGGSAPTYAQALNEGQHYLAQYQQDGPHTLEVRRVEVLHPDALSLLPEGAQVIEPAKHTILVPVPVPVAVSERLPSNADCDSEYRCWIGSWSDIDGELVFDWSYDSPKRYTWEGIAAISCWLPAHALPLPSGEVEA